MANISATRSLLQAARVNFLKPLVRTPTVCAQVLTLGTMSVIWQVLQYLLSASQKIGIFSHVIQCTDVSVHLSKSNEMLDGAD